MPRIRSLKPEFWSSPDHRGADPWVRLLYMAMWNWADDCGRGTANTRELAGFAFPDDEDDLTPTAKELPYLLKEVRGRYSVVFYEVDGRRYYAIPSWDRHQRTERKAQSRYPAPEGGVEYDPGPPDQPKGFQERKFSEVPAQCTGSSAVQQGSSGPVVSSLEQGNRGTGDTFGAAAVAAAAKPVAVVEDSDSDGLFEAPVVTAPPKPPPSEVKIAQAITRAYVEVVPMSRFPAVLGIVRRGLQAGHPPDSVQAALLRLAGEGRSVTVETLRIELEGRTPWRRTEDPISPGDRRTMEILGVSTVEEMRSVLRAGRHPVINGDAVILELPVAGEAS